MDLNKVYFWLKARTKKDMEQLPKNEKVQLRLNILEYGGAMLELWSANDNGQFASISIYSPDEMRRMATALNAIADATDICNADEPEILKAHQNK